MDLSTQRDISVPGQLIPKLLDVKTGQSKIITTTIKCV